MLAINQGEIYQVKLGKRKIYPCLVISPAQFNQSFKTLLVVPLIKASQCDSLEEIIRNFLLSPDLLNQIRVVERKNLMNKLTEVQFQLFEAVRTGMIQDYLSSDSNRSKALQLKPLRKKQPKRPKHLFFNLAFDHPSVQSVLRVKRIPSWYVKELITTYGHQSTIEVAQLMHYERIIALIDHNMITVQNLVNWLLDGGSDYVIDIINTIYHPIIVSLIKEDILIPEDIGLWSLIFSPSTIIKRVEALNQIENKTKIKAGIFTPWDFVASENAKENTVILEEDLNGAFCLNRR